jgi:hypothetical protein
MINDVEFYGRPGHLISHLTTIQEQFEADYRPIVYLLGDSILNNQSYLDKTMLAAVNGYEKILCDEDGNPGKMLPDVCYYLSKLMADNGKPYAVINSAIDKTWLETRKNNLTIHDMFVANRFIRRDVLVISIGADDLTVNPSLKTLWNLATLNYFNSRRALDYFVRMFRDNTQIYVNKLLENSNVKPSKIVLCMFFYPNRQQTRSSRPEILEAAIQQLHKSISQVTVPGVEIVACPLYEALDSNSADDYHDRLTPSRKGGKKIAKKLYQIICPLGPVIPKPYIHTHTT